MLRRSRPSRLSTWNPRSPTACSDWLPLNSTSAGSMGESSFQRRHELVSACLLDGSQSTHSAWGSVHESGGPIILPHPASLGGQLSSCTFGAGQSSPAHDVGSFQGQSYVHATRPRSTNNFLKPLPLQQMRSQISLGTPMPLASAAAQPPSAQARGSRTSGSRVAVLLTQVTSRYSAGLSGGEAYSSHTAAGAPASATGRCGNLSFTAAWNPASARIMQCFVLAHATAPLPDRAHLLPHTRQEQQQGCRQNSLFTFAAVLVHPGVLNDRHRVFPPRRCKARAVGLAEVLQQSPGRRQILPTLSVLRRAQRGGTVSCEAG